MNLYKLKSSLWIIILNIILIVILVMSFVLHSPTDSFINYAQQVDPTKVIPSNPEATSVNNNYASILMFLKKNPAKSGKFISDIKQKFFDDSCTVKNNIDFNNLAILPGGMPFS